jgi:hypothetical protein
MKQRSGSAILMILLVLTGMSMLLLRVHYRCSLLLETVIEREHQLIWYNAAQACMQYAIYLAKADWYHIQDLASNGRSTHFVTSWSLHKQRQVPAHIAFSISDGDMHISVQLYDQATLKRQITCTLKIIKVDEGKVAQVKIYGWYEE